MDAAYPLSSNIVNTKSESLTFEVVEATKKDILDTIGVALAGSGEPGIEPLAKLIKEWAGREESTIFSYGGKVPSLHAAQVNASMAHALDYDDFHTGGHLHLGVIMVPTALAVAEWKGGIDGKELITAIALGMDIAARMSMATILRNQRVIHGGWHRTPLYGYFGAAATAGRILGLNEEKMVNALGIAYHQVAGNDLCVVDGAMTKRMGAGFAARGGILSALMAERGITGTKNSLETPDFGFYDLYHAGCDRDKLTEDLGKRFEGAYVSLKPYPCCGLNNQYIDVTLELITENDIKPDEVKEIIATVHPHLERVVCSPLEVKRNPRNIIDRQFSIPWVLACAVVRRKVGLSEFAEDAMKDTAIRQLTQKVTYTIDPSLANIFAPAPVTIKTTRGEFSRVEKAALGHPQNPFGMEALIGKFKDCAAWGIKPLPKDNVEKLLDMIKSLEKLGDTSQIAQLL